MKLLASLTGGNMKRKKRNEIVRPFTNAMGKLKFDFAKKQSSVSTISYPLARLREQTDCYLH